MVTVDLDLNVKLGSNSTLKDSDFKSSFMPIPRALWKRLRSVLWIMTEKGKMRQTGKSNISYFLIHILFVFYHSLESKISWRDMAYTVSACKTLVTLKSFFMSCSESYAICFQLFTWLTLPGHTMNTGIALQISYLSRLPSYYCL